MKIILHLLLTAALLFVIPYLAESQIIQSMIEIQAGAAMEVTASADICGDAVISNGVYSGGGTKCGGPLPVKRKEVAAAPEEFSLSQNYPNPFNPATTIEFTLEEEGDVTLKIFDVAGREMATLVNEKKGAGSYYQVSFDASRLPSGTYFCRLESGGKQLTRKLLFVK